MQLSPQPRFRYYGSPRNYFEIAAGVLAGHLSGGERHVEALEGRLCDWIGAHHSLCMSQGRLALYLALSGLIKPGQKVILSPYTIFDVVNMVICAGGHPVFVDIEPETCNIDPRRVRELIDAETGAVIVTHLHGLACDIEEIAEICRARGLPLIEDAAQCLGGRVGGRPVGTFGDVGFFSFSLNKNVNTLYGGFLITDDDALHDRMRAELDSYPFEAGGMLLKRAAKCLVGDILTVPPIFQILTFPLLRTDFLHDGRIFGKFLQPESSPQLLTELPERQKRRMTALQARLALHQLDNIEPDARTRLSYARIYHEGLSGLPGIGLPPLREDGSHIYLAFPIQVPNRDRLVRHVMSRGCDVRVQSFTNAASLPCFSVYARPCPQAELTADRVVLLPTYPGYGERAVKKLIAAIRSFASN